MPYAIVLKCSNATAAPVLDLWREASGFESIPSMARLDYPPHLTFAIYEDILPTVLFATAQKVFGNMPAISIEFADIGHFLNEMLVLWARPADDRVLRQMHRAINDDIDPALCHEHYRPDHWQPHCTIAMSIPAASAAQALEWAARKRSGFTVTFDAVDCISFPPVEIIKQVELLP